MKIKDVDTKTLLMEVGFSCLVIKIFYYDGRKYYRVFYYINYFMVLCDWFLETNWFAISPTGLGRGVDTSRNISKSFTKDCKNEVRCSIIINNFSGLRIHL